MELDGFRAQFATLGSRAYLFSGALAPAAAAVRAEWDAWSDAWSSDPNTVYTESAMLGRMASLRETFASLVNANASEIALTDNTSRAANIAVRIVESRGAGNVVVDDSTYPSSVYPWRAHDRDVRYVATTGVADPTGAITDAITDETIAVCVTHVGPFSGRRHDLAALASAAHAHGAVLMVDAAQTAGVVPIDVQTLGIDLLYTTGMKWLLGPPGIGYLYVCPEVLSQAPVLDVGYIGLEEPFGEWPVSSLPPMSNDARRYELGMPSLPALAASRTGIELLLAVGIEQVAERVEALVTRCLDGLSELGQMTITPHDPGMRAGVIVFEHEEPADLFNACRAQGVDIGYVGKFVRVDPHAFNTEKDIERFLDCYRQFELAGRH